MFGSADRLEQELRDGGGRSAPAEVTEAKAGRFATSHGNTVAEQMESSTVTWKLKLRVTPDGDVPFDAAFKAPFPQLSGPSVGETLTVLYDPSDHSKIAVDHSSEAKVDAYLDKMESRMA